MLLVKLHGWYKGVIAVKITTRDHILLPGCMWLDMVLLRQILYGLIKYYLVYGCYYYTRKKIDITTTEMNRRRRLWSLFQYWCCKESKVESK